MGNDGAVEVNRSRGVNVGWYANRRTRGGWTAPTTNLIADYNASNVSGVSDGSLVSTIPEPINSHNLLQTGAARATFLATGGADSTPCLRFSGAQSYPIPAGLSIGSRDLTVYALVRLRSMPAGVLLRFGTGGGSYLFASTIGKAPNLYNSAGGSLGPTTYLPQGTDPYRWTLLTMRCGADGTRFRRVAGTSSQDDTGAALTNQTLTGGELGCWNAGFFGTFDLMRLLIYGEAHDSTQMAVVEAGLSSFYSLPRPFPSGANVLVGHGHSWVYGWSSAADGGYMLPAATAAGMSCLNYGYPGRTMATLSSEAASLIDSQYVAGRKLVVQELVNDVYGGLLTAAQIYSAYKAYAAARKAIGWKIVLLDVPTNLPAFDATKQTRAGDVNAFIAADFNTATLDSSVWLPSSGITYADALLKISTLGLSYSDGLHTNDAGYATISTKLGIALGLI